MTSSMDELTLDRLEGLAYDQGRLFDAIRVDRKLFAGVLVLFAILLALVALNFASNRTAIAQANYSIEQARIGTCALAESITNALIKTTTPPADEAARAALQARIDAFVFDLQTRSSVLRCSLAIIDAPSVN